ncbi:MAG TPA: hypothetical protein VLA73_07920, partial [Burkholderiales bacterium]|nr:hypothetical protein [Burkholderiales bacterium]
MRDPLQKAHAVAGPARPAGEVADSDLFAELRSYLNKHRGDPGPHALTELVRALYLDGSAFYFDSLEPLDPAGRKLAGALIQAKLADIHPLEAWESAYQASLELDQPRKNASAAPAAVAPEPIRTRSEEAVEEPLVEPAATAAGAHVIGEVEIVDERPEPTGDSTSREAPQRAPGTSRSAKTARLLGLVIALAAAALVLAVPMGPTIQGALSEWGAITFLSKHALDAAVEPQIETHTAEPTAPQKVVRSVERPQSRNATANEAPAVTEQSVHVKEIAAQPPLEEIQSAPPPPSSTLQPVALNPSPEGPRGRVATLPDSTPARAERQTGGPATDAVKAQRDRPERKTLASAAPTTLGKKSATSAAKAFEAEQMGTGSSALDSESNSLDTNVSAPAADKGSAGKGAVKQTALGAGQSALNSGPNGKGARSGKQLGQPAVTVPVALAPSNTSRSTGTRSATSGSAKPEPPASVRVESSSSGSGSTGRVEVAPLERWEKLQQVEPPVRAEKVEPVQREPMQRVETIQRVETRVENSGPSERAVRPDLIQKLERVEVPKVEKIERVELPKIEKVERVELPKIEKPERVELPKIEKPERVELPMKIEKPERVELPIKIEKPERVEVQKVERVQRVELPVKV